MNNDLLNISFAPFPYLLYNKGMKVVRSYLKVRLAEKALRENRTLSLRKVVEESGVSTSTVNRLANNTIKRVPLDELALLCCYLECDIGDLLHLEEAQG